MVIKAPPPRRPVSAQRERKSRCRSRAAEPTSPTANDLLPRPRHAATAQAVHASPANIVERTGTPVGDVGLMGLESRLAIRIGLFAVFANACSTTVATVAEARAFEPLRHARIAESPTKPTQRRQTRKPLR